mgnify:CR=1 FL=1
MNDTLRIVVVAPDLAITNPDDQHAARLAPTLGGGSN